LGPGLRSSENLRTQITRSVFVLFFVNFIREPRHVMMIYLVAILLMLVSAITGIQGVLHGGGLYGYRAEASSVIAQSGNPNRLAMFAIMAIAGVYYLTTWLSFPGSKLLVSPLIGVLGLCVFMTGSRSGLLGLGVCVISIIIDEGLSLQKMFAYSLAAAIVAVLAVQFTPEKTLERITNLPFTEAGETGLGSSSLQGRQYVWGQAIQMFRENPVLGVGIGNWDLARFLADPIHSVGAPHSSYLLALCEGGVLCLLGYLLLLWRCWQNIRFGEWYLADPDVPYASNLLWIVKSMKANFIALVFFSIFADLWQLVILFWLVGLSVSVRRLVEESLLQEEFAS
jgi:O-antigen ligase